MKSLIRSEVISHLHQLSFEEKTKSSARIQQYLEQELKNESGTWAGYQCLSTEPCIDWAKIAPHLKWVFPVCDGDTLHFKDSGSGFARSELGIQEPVSGVPIRIQEINGFVIPGLGYDSAGYRLGRGKGYYDRSVAQTNNKKIGVCFQVSFFENLPVESHDLRCDKIITEKEVYQVSKVEGVQKWN